MAKALLGSTLEDLRGGVGNLVVRMRNGRTIIGQKPVYRKQFSPKQKVTSARFKQAGNAWMALSYEEGLAWNAAAKGLATTGHTYFMRLAAKFLQVNPDEAPPNTPPLARFMGDTVFYSMAAVPGGIEFSATGTNTPPSCTELLIEKLASIHRKPSQRWQSAGFVSFTVENLTATLELDPGPYATATRFVDSATGQMTPWQWGERVVVG
ncbi:MAG: hypothetical protein WCO51_05220 [bacterium]